MSGRKLGWRRSVLFFPATRPDRFDKAVAAGVDAVCIDLEDAVPPQAKAEARRRAVELLERTDRPAAEVCVRINDVKSEDGLEDLLSLCRAGQGPDTVIIPKVDAAAEVQWAERILERRHPDHVIIPMIETVRGLRAAHDIAAAAARVDALLFGGFDLAAELRCAAEWEALLHPRSRVVEAAAFGQVDAIDTPFVDVASRDALRAECVAAARLGFKGKLAIHPNQVPVIQQAFTPTEAEVAAARRIIDAFAANRESVLLLDGRMVERPLIEAAMRMVARADALVPGGPDTESG